MSVNHPTPAGEGQLTSGDPLGGQSCVAYSFAYAVADATDGKHHPTGRQIREWTGDRYGGLELGQGERAVELHYPDVEFVTTVLTRAQFYAKRKAGFVMVLIGGYKPIARSQYSGQDYFWGNHAIEVNPRDVKDPLADGRHPGTYKYHGADYPEWLIDLFAAALRLANGRPAGANHFEVSYTKAKGVAVLPDYKVRIDAGVNVGLFKVNLGTRTVIGNPKGWKFKGPGQYTSNVTRPKTYKRAGHAAVHLAQVNSGALKGKFINVRNSAVHLEER